MRKTPSIAKVYLFLAAVLIALPTVGGDLYQGVTGKYLVASEKLRAGYFDQSVIYVVKHNLFGATGVVVNRPLKEAELAALDKVLAGEEVLAGGPVKSGQLYALLYDPTSSAKAVQLIAPEKQTVDSFVEFARRYPNQLFIMGYSGWGPLQLEIEMMRGDWDTAPADLGKMFSKEVRDGLWPALKRQGGGYEFNATKI